MRAFTLIELIVVLVILFVLVGLCGVGWPGDLLFNLVAGWGWYLARVAGQVRVNWIGVLTALVCLALLSLGLHGFCRWLYGRPAAPEGRLWRKRWTASLLGAVVLMFVAGIAAVGVTHQTAWLLTSPEPLTEGGMRQLAAKIQSENNLKQIGMGSHDHNDAVGSLPQWSGDRFPGAEPHGWQTLLLPYVEQDALFKTIKLNKPWDHSDNAGPMRKEVKLYLHPAIDERTGERGYALSHYAGNVRVFAGKARRIPADFPDGASQTLLAGEAAGNHRPWGHPANWRDPG